MRAKVAELQAVLVGSLVNNTMLKISTKMSFQTVCRWLSFKVVLARSLADTMFRLSIKYQYGVVFQTACRWPSSKRCWPA